MANNNQRGRNNNNPHGHNQNTNEWLAPVKDHPIASAAAAAAAVGAGVFLWSKRNQVGNQVSKISRTANEMGRRASNKASSWMDQLQSHNSSSREVALTEGPNESAAIEASRATGGKSRKTNANMNAGRAGAKSVSY